MHAPENSDSLGASNLLMTIGYEGMTIGTFVQKLSSHDVQILLDVRKLPLSRKPGFSKTAMARHLLSVGIRYHHFPTLGCPELIRYAYRADSDWEAYVEKYEAYIDSQLAEGPSASSISLSSAMLFDVF